MLCSMQYLSVTNLLTQNLCHACLIHSMHSMTMHESRVLQGFDYVLMVNRADALQTAHMGTWRMQTMRKRDGGGDQAG